MSNDLREKLVWLAATFLMLGMVAGTAAAQGRGGPRGGGGLRAGTVEHVVVHGKSLEGNREGDSADRNVTVYLPPSYAGDQARRFPVIYFLHDYGAHSDGPIEGMKEFADKLASVQGFSEPIVVVPDATTMQKGSMYSTSAATGDWERFIAEDLVASIDGHYRTLAARISRGLAGQSMGGYGALRIGMKRPEVFSSLYVMSACCLDGANAPLTVLDQYSANLKKYYAIAIEIGSKDAFLALNQQLHNEMLRLRIPHNYQEYDDQKAGERFERNLLPFFSKNLAAPANPTSPGVH